MRQSRQTIVNELLTADQNRCCPNCARTDSIIPILVRDEYEQFKCGTCNQMWTVGYRLIYSVEVAQRQEE